MGCQYPHYCVLTVHVIKNMYPAKSRKCYGLCARNFGLVKSRNSLYTLYLSSQEIDTTGQRKANKWKGVAMGVLDVEYLYILFISEKYNS